MSSKRLKLNPAFGVFTHDNNHYGHMACHEFPMAFMALSPELESLLLEFRSPRSISEFSDDSGAKNGLGEFLSTLEARGVLVPEDYAPAVIDYEKEFPNSITLLPTTRCNLNCQYCYAEAGDHKAEDLPVETVEAVLRYLIPNQPDKNKIFSMGYLGGGEPTLRFDLIKRSVALQIALCEERGIKPKINIVSNGNFNDTVMDWILEHDVRINFSLDGPEDLQNLQRPLRNGGGSYERIAKNAARLKEAGKTFGTRATVTPQAVPRLKEIVEDAVSLGASRVHLEPCSGESGRAKLHEQKLDADSQQFVDSFLEILPWAMENGVYLFTTGLLALRPGKGTYCGAQNPNLMVAPSGALTTCPEVCETRHPASSSFLFGRILPSGELEINQEMVDKLRARRGENLSPCRDCFLHNTCGGGCMARAFANTGNAFGYDSLNCLIFKQMSGRVVSAIADGALIPGDEAWLPRTARCEQGDYTGRLVTLIPKKSPLRRTRQYRPITQLLKKGPSFTLAPGASL